MHDTLASLVERAVAENSRPLEFFLREHSRLPGPRANLELADDVSYLLAAAVPRHPENVRSLLSYFANGDRKMVASNTPSEFVMMCGILSYGACAAVQPAWRQETYELLKHYACSAYWRIRESVALAFQRLLLAAPDETFECLFALAKQGNYLQQRAAIAATAEPVLLTTERITKAAIEIERIVLERLHSVAPLERKNEDFRILRRTLGYTLSIITVAMPEEGFALMRECAHWNDSDVVWILRENLKKKRLARFVQDTQVLSQLLSSPQE
jgi:hypothetical protein